MNIANSGIIQRSTRKNWLAGYGNGTQPGALDGKNTSNSSGKVNFPAARAIPHAASDICLLKKMMRYMDMLSKIILIAFIVFSVILILFVIRIISRGISIVARPPINPLAFVTAKLCAFSSCFFIPAGIIWPGLRWYSTPEWLGLAAMLPFFSGIVIAAVAMKKLGDDLIFGLPESSISSLKTDGIFRISRNPLYLGFILLILSSCLITPNPFNFAAALIAIVIHHRIILQEENYLISKLGNQYHEYMKTTGRYLLHI